MRLCRSFAPPLVAPLAPLVLLAQGLTIGCAARGPVRAESAHGAPPVAWTEWSDDVFERAAAQRRLVLLDLEAVWCHWCHVMHRKTYADADVAGLIRSHFIAVRVDQDARPDLAHRYRDYGWPATIVFDASGRELVKLAGFIEPREMARILRRAVHDPNPAPAERAAPIRYAARGALPEELRAELIARHERAFDDRIGGLRTAHRYLEADGLEWALRRAAGGDERDAARARLTLRGNLKLIDPAWGGVYQYSTHGDWDHPHFEKIMSSQCANLRIYALAYAQWGETGHRDAIERIVGYVRGFLTAPHGAFYTSQDADVVRGQHGAAYFALSDEQRRRIGVPAVDRHVYARENGWMISALTACHAAISAQECAVHERGQTESGVPSPGTPRESFADGLLADALRAADWIVANRSLPDGGFRHDEQDAGGPYLGDTLSMGRAMLDLYAATADRRRLERSRAALAFIAREFVDPEGPPGFLTSSPRSAGALAPVRLLDENIQLARYANLLHHYTGDPAHRALAEHALRYLASGGVALEAITEAGVLLADDELARPPLHVAVVGRGDEPATRALRRAALALPTAYKRIDLVVPGAPPLPNTTVEYPEFDRPAAFLCANGRCSRPIFDPEEIATAATAFRE